MCKRVLVYGDAEERAAARDLEVNTRCIIGNGEGGKLVETFKVRFFKVWAQVERVDWIDSRNFDDQNRAISDGLSGFQARAGFRRATWTHGFTVCLLGLPAPDFHISDTYACVKMDVAHHLAYGELHVSHTHRHF